MILEEMETDIDEPIDLTFAPPEQIRGGRAGR